MMSAQDLVSPPPSPTTGEHVLSWVGDGRFEFAHATARLGTFSARGTLLTGGTEPYRVDYQLDTGAGLVTKRVTVQAAGLGWTRTLRLARDAEGGWNVRRTAESPDDQVRPLDPTVLTDATDCSIAMSALTPTMPVLRHRLHAELGRAVVVAAWVSLPDLTVHRQEHTYAHLRTGAVRLAAGTFSADLELDADGFVRGYPNLANRA